MADTGGDRRHRRVLGVTPAEVSARLRSTTCFTREPTGKYLVSVCTNIACMLRGAYELLEHAEEHLGIRRSGRPRIGCSRSKRRNAWPTAAGLRACRSTTGSSVT